MRAKKWYGWRFKEGCEIGQIVAMFNRGQYLMELIIQCLIQVQG